MTDARYEAVKLLGKTFGRGSYSNILLDGALAKSDMDERDKRLCSAIYYGTLERKITLDFIISKYCRQKITKLRPEILNILRTGIYQLKFMDSIPDSAAVNESVNLTKKLRLNSLSGFVNGVLRSFIRDGKKIKYPENYSERLSVEYSVPLYLVKLLLDNYGEDGISLIETSLGSPPVTVRLNTLVYNRDEILKEISELEPKNTLIEDCYEIFSQDITNISAYKKGMFHVQDIASQLCCMALCPEAGDTVLDLCAAPGGKTFTIAEQMRGKGIIYSFDLHESRVKLIASGAERLKLGNIRALTGNAAEFNPDIPKADKILCDVPCSGLGVIRRKPEIKYKSFKEFDRLPEIQYNILENASHYLKTGGELIYSTCTVNPAENEGVVDRFLINHPEFEGSVFLENLGFPFGTYKATLFPKYFGSDGFFISKLKKME